MPTMINGYLEVNDARESFLHNTMFKHLTLSSSGAIKHNRRRQVAFMKSQLQILDFNAPTGIYWNYGCLPFAREPHRLVRTERAEHFTELFILSGQE